jgi:hypothetical protein
MSFIFSSLVNVLHDIDIWRESYSQVYTEYVAKVCYGIAWLSELA